MGERLLKETFKLKNQLLLSNHAGCRANKRNLSYEDITFVCTHGFKLSNAGVAFRQLRHDRIPAQMPGNNRCWQLVGTTVVLCPTCESCVITAYRDPAAFQKDKRKEKYNWKRQASCCPHCHPQQDAA